MMLLSVVLGLYLAYRWDLRQERKELAMRWRMREELEPVFQRYREAIFAAMVATESKR